MPHVSIDRSSPRQGSVDACSFGLPLDLVRMAIDQLATPDIRILAHQAADGIMAEGHTEHDFQPITFGVGAECLTVLLKVTGNALLDAARVGLTEASALPPCTKLPGICANRLNLFGQILPFTPAFRRRLGIITPDLSLCYVRIRYDHSR